ncbi:MAG TPA: DUF4136 domain-containing protein [Methylibium sp.]|nr:DUF4136 domain-containing protein [Methylibium sp.]
MQRRTALTTFSALAAVATLPLVATGCAGLDTVAVDVASQGSWPAGRKPGTYAIERLPSQQANAAEQERIEAAALGALQAAGFTPAPQAEADVLIQLGARVFEVARRDRYAYSSIYWRSDWWFHGGRWPHFWGPGYGLGYASEFPDYQREVAVLMRDRRTQQFVYETRGSYTSRWTSDALLPAMFDAVLKDFPHTALSPRTVTVALPKAKG